MNISKLHHRWSEDVYLYLNLYLYLLLNIRIDELEDEIIREKLKINAVSGQLDDTFNEMLNKY